jgi:hypothetical protein
MTSHDRRELFPRHLRRAGDTLTIARHDRREIFTELEEFCRCYHTPRSISRHRSRCRLTFLQDFSQEPTLTDPAMSAEGKSDEFSDDAPPAQGGSSTD